MRLGEPIDGFTLIEVLVAFAVATTSLGLMFHIHSNAAVATRLAEDYVIATELAQSLLAEHAALARDDIAFSLSGVSLDRFRWAVHAEEHTHARNPTQVPYELRDIKVTVSWQAQHRERRVELRTLKPFFEGMEP